METQDDIQRKHILKALEKTGGRIFGNRGAAKILNINPKTLESRIKRLGIRKTRTFSDI
jgi:formate hydrogenlyase transcriptional activator